MSPTTVCERLLNLVDSALLQIGARISPRLAEGMVKQIEQLGCDDPAVNQRIERTCLTLRVELAIEANDHSRAATLAQHVRDHFANDAELYFMYTCSKAESLHALGQHDEAIRTLCEGFGSAAKHRVATEAVYCILISASRVGIDDCGTCATLKDAALHYADTSLTLLPGLAEQLRDQTPANVLTELLMELAPQNSD